MSTDTTNAIATVDWTDDELQRISSFEDALNLVKSKTEIVRANDVLGDGFALLDASEKDSLIGLPCILVKWEFHESDIRKPDGGPAEFVSVHVVARNKNGSMTKAIINDGGSGIYQQLRDYTDKSGVSAGLVVARGLRRSDYIHPEHGSATTYYLDTSGQ